MAKKNITGLGSQAVSKFFEQPAPEQEEVKQEEAAGIRSLAGRPQTIKREYEKSSQEGLPENWTRATFIVREDLLSRLKDLAYTERRSLKELINEMIAQYLDGKEIIERGDK